MRIVSLCPSLTELVFDLGRGDDLVGVTTFCIHPASGVAALEKVGGTKNPKLERIIALAPDLVLLNEEENRREDAETLAGAGLQCLATFPKTVPETAAMVRDIARAVERPEAGEALARDIETRAARIRAAVAGLPPVRFAYLIWREPWMAAGRDTYVDGLLSEAGGENVFAGEKARYPKVSIAALRAADPDRVLLSSEPYPFKEEHVDEIVKISTLSRGRLLLADGEALSWHGSRTPEGLDYAYAVLRSGCV